MCSSIAKTTGRTGAGRLEKPGIVVLGGVYVGGVCAALTSPGHNPGGGRGETSRYLSTKAMTNQKSSNMRLIVSAYRLCEELELMEEFVPKGTWFMVRGKDWLARLGASQGWGSLETLEAMAKRVRNAEEKIVVPMAKLSVVYCL